MATTYGSIPKSLQRIVNDPRVDEVGNEGEDGYWIYLKSGWKWEDCHCVHEWTVEDTIRAFRDVEPCNCEGCVKRQ